MMEFLLAEVQSSGGMSCEELDVWETWEKQAEEGVSLRLLELVDPATLVKEQTSRGNSKLVGLLKLVVTSRPAMAKRKDWITANRFV